MNVLEWTKTISPRCNVGLGGLVGFTNIRSIYWPAKSQIAIATIQQSSGFGEKKYLCTGCLIKCRTLSHTERPVSLSEAWWIGKSGPLWRAFLKLRGKCAKTSWAVLKSAHCNLCLVRSKRATIFLRYFIGMLLSQVYDIRTSEKSVIVSN